MNVWDILILALVGVMIYFAVRAIHSGRAGSCHDCNSCSHDCAHCGHPCPTHKENDRP
ncbi:MAG: hypothetical protein IKM82_08470 [Oscillospiraceae bacterium]|nr:hypothetical protein [Oscillospiraceae bacterium]